MRKQLIEVHFKVLAFGVGAGSLLIGWIVLKDGIFDWPTIPRQCPTETQLKETGPPAVQTSILFLAVNALVWSRWALVLRQLREKIRVSGDGVDFIRTAGLAPIPGMTVCLMLGLCLFAVYDDFLKGIGTQSPVTLECSCLAAGVALATASVALWTLYRCRSVSAS